MRQSPRRNLRMRAGRDAVAPNAKSCRAVWSSLHTAMAAMMLHLEVGGPRHDDSAGIVRDNFACRWSGKPAWGRLFLFRVLVHLRNQNFLFYRTDIRPNAL